MVNISYISWQKIQDKKRSSKYRYLVFLSSFPVFFPFQISYHRHQYEF